MLKVKLEYEEFFADIVADPNLRTPALEIIRGDRKEDIINEKFQKEKQRLLQIKTLSNDTRNISLEPGPKRQQYSI